LAIVKHLIELHGGRVSGHSRGEGFGARFVVQLPLVVRAATARSAPTSAGKPGRAHDPHTLDLRGVKVVMVDDDADACDLVARTLGGCGACVITADSAHAALALVESERPDVMLSDIGMPEMDGFALLEAVRALGPARGGTVPAIAITAYALTEDRNRTAAGGFRLHMAKPVEPAALVAAVAEILGRDCGLGRNPM
jgi:CheY-like chemotaxis protein